jgi:hypothetical protein
VFGRLAEGGGERGGGDAGEDVCAQGAGEWGAAECRSVCAFYFRTSNVRDHKHDGDNMGQSESQLGMYGTEGVGAEAHPVS